MNEFCKDFLDAESSGGKPALSAFNALCESCSPGAKGLLFLPYLSGELHPILDAKASGAFLGLRLEHSRAEMGRALLEGIAHAVSHNLFYAQSISPPIDELRATGGPSNSPVLCQAIADITEIPVKVLAFKNKAGGAPLGNALLAQRATTKELSADFEEQLLTVHHVYEPNTKHQPMYRKQHDLYQRIYQQNIPLFHDLYHSK